MAYHLPKLILFSSDSNVQYEKDIYNVIALPYNGEYRFRYKSEYIDSNAMQLLNDVDKIKNERILIAFRTNSVSEETDHFMVPVRWATFNKVERIDKFYIIWFTAKDYPLFSSEFEKAMKSYNSNVEFSKRFFSVDNRNTIFVSSETPDIVLPNESENLNTSEQEKAWTQIIEALSQHNIFKNRFFFKTITTIDGNTKSVKMKENKQSLIEIVHYCNSDDKNDLASNVEIQYDSNILISVLGNQEQIECSYDKNYFPFLPKYINQKLNTTITFAITSKKYDQETKIQIPVKIYRSNKKRLIRAGISLVGALCLGVGGILNCIPTFSKIMLFILGSIGVASSWLFSKD